MYLCKHISNKTCHVDEHMHIHNTSPASRPALLIDDKVGACAVLSTEETAIF